jgi:subtilisin family serine protease
MDDRTDADTDAEDALTALLIERHRAVLTQERPALVRADHLLATSADAESLPTGLSRWLDTPRPTGTGLCRLPQRAGTGAHVNGLLSDVHERYRRLSVGPVHLLRSCPKWGGGPADPPAVVEGVLPRPADPDPDAPVVTVAILDTGIARHQWFTGRDWFADVGADAIEVLDADADYRLDAQAGHGTFVAGLLLGRAPSARLRIVRLLHSDGVCDEIDLIEALQGLQAGALARQERIDIVNLSLGCHTYDDRPSPAVVDAVAALGRRTVVVAAAGNQGDDRPFWPAALKTAVGVGALDAVAGERAPFSNFGWWVDACAVGERTRSSFVEFDGPTPATGVFDRDRFTGYAEWSGTSFAAPVVAGEIARLAADRGVAAADAADLVLDPRRARVLPDLGVAVGAADGTAG